MFFFWPSYCCLGQFQFFLRLAEVAYRNGNVGACVFTMLRISSVPPSLRRYLFFVFEGQENTNHTRGCCARYEGGGFFYHTTMPTDAMRKFRDAVSLA
jgi:hypothetical protein